MHRLIFLNSVDEFLKTSYINEVIYIKLSIIEINLTDEFTRIVTSVMLHGLCRKISPYLPYMSNT